jgi:hypothetical protein
MYPYPYLPLGIVIDVSPVTQVSVVTQTALALGGSATNAAVVGQLA